MAHDSYLPTFTVLKLISDTHRVRVLVHRGADSVRPRAAVLVLPPAMCQPLAILRLALASSNTTQRQPRIFSVIDDDVAMKHVPARSAVMVEPIGVHATSQSSQGRSVVCMSRVVALGRDFLRLTWHRFAPNEQRELAGLLRRSAFVSGSEGFPPTFETSGCEGARIVVLRGLTALRSVLAVTDALHRSETDERTSGAGLAFHSCVSGELEAADALPPATLPQPTIPQRTIRLVDNMWRAAVWLVVGTCEEFAEALRHAVRAVRAAQDVDGYVPPPLLAWLDVGCEESAASHEVWAALQLRDRRS
jgi:hypothetical protein